MKLSTSKRISGNAIIFVALVAIICAWATMVHADDAALATQVAKAIQSDEQGKKFFTTEQGLVDFLVATLGADPAKAAETARHMIKDDLRGNRYYYLPEGGGPQTLSDLLKNLIKPKETTKP